MGRKNIIEMEPEDPTGWILDNGFAEFVLMHTNEIVSNLTVTYGVICKILSSAILYFIAFTEIHGDAWIYVLAW